MYFKIIIGLILIAVLLCKVPFASTIQAIEDTSYSLVLAAVLITGLGIILTAFRLHTLLRLKNKEVKLWPVIRAYYIGFFFNNFMPTEVGGDVFKINELKKDNLRLKDVAAAVIVERIIGALALVILAVFLSIPGVRMFEKVGMDNLHPVFLIAIPFACIAVIIARMAWNNFIKAYLEQRKTHFLWGRVLKVIEPFYIFRNNMGILTKVFIISLIFHLLGAFNLLIVATAVGKALPFLSLLVALVATRIVSMLPISIGALGVREGMFVLCLTRLGLAAPISLAIALLLRFSTYVHSGIGGIWYILKK